MVLFGIPSKIKIAEESADKYLREYGIEPNKCELINTCGLYGDPDILNPNYRFWTCERTRGYLMHGDISNPKFVPCPHKKCPQENKS